MKLLIFSLILLISIYANQKGQPSRFERFYRECSSNECKERVNDDNCIYKCMNSNCYESIYGNYLIEYGEVVQDLKNKFERCFNSK